LEKYPIGFGHPKKGDEYSGYSLKLGRDLTPTKSKRSKVEIKTGCDRTKSHYD
jgi:hypothetical protein